MMLDFPIFSLPFWWFARFTDIYSIFVLDPAMTCKENILMSNRHSHSGIAQQFTKANKDWTSSDGGQLRLYKRRPNPFQLEKGATEPNEDEAPTARGS